MKRRYTVIGLTLLAVVGLVLVFTTPQAVQSQESTTGKTPDSLWTERCSEMPAGTKARRGYCEIFQRLSVQQTGQRFIEFAIGFPRDKDAARGIVILPLGILLEPGVVMRIDDGEVFTFNVRYCDAGGCYAYVTLNDHVLDIMRKGKVVNITFTSAQSQKMNVDLGLKGFTKSLKNIM